MKKNNNEDTFRVSDDVEKCGVLQYFKCMVTNAS